MQKAINRACWPRRTYAQLAARQLFKLYPLTRLDTEVLKQVSLERNLSFRCDHERRCYSLQNPHLKVGKILITIKINKVKWPRFAEV